MKIHYASSDELCETIRAEGCDTAIVSFSRGKDSYAVVEKLRRYFGRVVLYHLDLLPEPLRIETEAIERWQSRGGEPVLRYTHPGTLKQLRALVYQPPSRIAAIQAADLPRDYTVDAIEADVRRRVGAPDAWVALGLRAADSIQRRTHFKTHGAVLPGPRAFYPVFDYTIDDVDAAVRRLGIPLPNDYNLFGRSLDAISHDFLAPLRAAYPDDYERVIRWFPLAEAGVHRTTLRTNRRIPRTLTRTTP